ncbi:hypothetical protein [Methanospirillum lacunae]|uniref:Uncharacterized protein n=1 Tax=Methanospirillum lacunae TaxID=668570 RepID=A0A2V2N1Z0_9EURY|nr:hypothetical protein [Methanospirillum lacunae]PWR74132.1 hypothetical protein DK846_02965 [Methanospirillum lacunae]
MRDWSLLTRIVPCALILLFAVHVSAIPPMPTEFYGSVVIDGKPAPSGTNITAMINGDEKGSIKTVVDGFYGGPGIFDDRLKVSVPEEEYKPGMLKISFKIGDKQAVQTVDYEPGVSKQLDLAVGTGSTTMASPATYMTPVDNITSISTNNAVVNSDSGPYSSSTSGSTSSGSGTTISYGLDQDRIFKAEDGLAELQFGKATMLFSPEGQFLSAVGIRPKSVSDLPPLSTNKSLKFTGYAYEIIPSETYFNPKGILVLKLPPERAYDIISAGPSLYEYISQTASWEPVHTTSSAFTNEITGDIYEAAIYALYIPSESHQINQSVQNSVNNQTQGSSISSGGVSYQPSIPIDAPVTPITTIPANTPEVTTPVPTPGEQGSNPQTPVITPLPSVTPAVQTKTITNSSSQKNPGPVSLTPLTSITNKVPKSVLSIIGIVCLIIIINAAVYAVYRYWWQKRKQNG